jgi:hypothetical protein
VIGLLSIETVFFDVSEISAVERFIEEDDCQIGIGLEGMGDVTSF